MRHCKVQTLNMSACGSREKHRRRWFQAVRQGIMEEERVQAKPWRQQLKTKNKTLKYLYSFKLHKFKFKNKIMLTWKTNTCFVAGQFPSVPQLPTSFNKAFVTYLEALFLIFPSCPWDCELIKDRNFVSHFRNPDFNTVTSTWLVLNKHFLNE